MSIDGNEKRAHRSERPGEPPTLPLPSWWRLVIAAVVVISFLYLMYSTSTESPTQAQGQHSGRATVSSRA